MDKDRIYIIEIFRINTPYQVIKVEIEVKFYQTIRRDLIFLKLDI